MQEGTIEVEQDWNEYGVEFVHITSLKDKIKEAFTFGEVDIKELGNSVSSVVTYLMAHPETGLSFNFDTGRINS